LSSTKFELCENGLRYSCVNQDIGAVRVVVSGQRILEHVRGVDLDLEVRGDADKALRERVRLRTSEIPLLIRLPCEHAWCDGGPVTQNELSNPRAYQTLGDVSAERAAAPDGDGAAREPRGRRA